jgi:hypothetical protein
MISLRVNRVHTDGVGAELLEVWDITLACFGVGEGVFVVVGVGFGTGIFLYEYSVLEVQLYIHPSILTLVGDTTHVAEAQVSRIQDAWKQMSYNWVSLLL